MIFSYKGVYKYIDMLVSFVYDEVENSQNGRQLAGISKDGLTASYAYNDSGIRLRKTVNGVATQYFLNGSMIVAEVTGDVQTDYYYDESGNVFGFKRGDSEYYYIRNGQGDIIGILDSSGTRIASYVYDSWGKLVSVTDASGNDKSGDASFIGNLNPSVTVAITMIPTLAGITSIPAIMTPKSNGLSMRIQRSRELTIKLQEKICLPIASTIQSC